MATQPVEKELRPTAAPQTVTWFVFGAGAAVFVGWVGSILNLENRAPVGVLPVMVGYTLGVILGLLRYLTHVNCRKWLIVGAALLAILAVLSEHAWLYRDFRRQWHEARNKSPRIAMFRPETPWSPAEYFTHEATPGRVTLWCVDAALVTGVTVGTVLMIKRVFK